MSSTIDTDERESSQPLAGGVAGSAVGTAVGGAFAGAAIGAAVGVAALGAAAAVGYRYYKRSVADDALMSEELQAIVEQDRQALEGQPDPEMHARRRFLELVNRGSIDTRSAARLLGISEEAVIARIEGGHLYGIAFSGGWRIPSFQFEGRNQVRGLDRVLPELRRDLHPLEVLNWLTLAHEQLTVGGQAVSPLQWLRTGGDAARVASLGRSVGSIA